ncbi:MAG: AAA family ATPase [Bacteroidota bacterium]|nr:AAA family ATPase [Bacteroidota bacterium]
MKCIEPTSDLNPTEVEVFNIIKEQFEHKCSVKSILLSKYYLLMNNKRDCEIVGFFSVKPHTKWTTKTNKSAYNLVILFEVKSHSNFEIRENNQVVIKYSNETKDAFAQVDTSARKLQEHLKANGIERAWVYNFLCFPNVSTYKEISNVDYSNSHVSKHILLKEEINFDVIIEKCSIQREVRRSDGLYFSSYIDKTNSPFNQNDKIFTILSGISKPVVLGKFDKKRLEGVANDKIKVANYLSDLDDNNLIVTGKAGSGKTIALLKLAISQVENFKHILILTFNTALASDINRLIEYYFEHYNPGLVKHREHIKVINIDQLLWDYDSTIKSYQGESRILSNSYEDNYSKIKDSIDSFMIEFGVKEVRELLNFNYDFILIDEGQDFDEMAFDVLVKLNDDHARLFVVDSPDQLLKYTRPAILDSNVWTKRARNTNYRNFKKINKYSNKLRRYLKNALLDVEQNLLFENTDEDIYSIELPEGTIEIMNDSLLFQDDRLKKIIEKTENKCEGEKWPLLFIQSQKDGKQKELFDYLKKIKCEYWNGYDPSVRKSVIYDTNKIRVIDYESCRGLEGWTVVLRNIDIAYNASLEHTSDADRNKAIERACNLIFIATTRPIENLVITYTDKKFGDMLAKYTDNL